MPDHTYIIIRIKKEDSGRRPAKLVEALKPYNAELITFVNSTKNVVDNDFIHFFTNLKLISEQPRQLKKLLKYSCGSLDLIKLKRSRRGITRRWGRPSESETIINPSKPSNTTKGVLKGVLNNLILLGRIRIP